jgi:hypothetical protein
MFPSFPISCSKYVADNALFGGLDDLEVALRNQLTFGACAMPDLPKATLGVFVRFSWLVIDAP